MSATPANTALTKEEQAWGRQIDWESMAKSWGKEQFHQILSGQCFTSWGDQRPLIPLYNDYTKTCSVRINKHRQKVLDLSFTDKYMPGKEIPCDFNSRHPNSIDHLTTEERIKLGLNGEDEVTIRRIFIRDLPDAVSLDMIRKVREADPIYRASRRPSRMASNPRRLTWFHTHMSGGNWGGG